MTKLTKLGKREKNRWLKELEEYDRERREGEIERLQKILDEEWDRSCYEDSLYDDYGWEDYDDSYEDRFDILPPGYDWDEEDFGGVIGSTGDHIIDAKGRYYIVSSKGDYVNLLTGECTRYLESPKILWRK